MLNIYLSSLWEKMMFPKPRFSEFNKIRFQFSFWRVPTHEDIFEFWNFLLQLKNQMSGSKSVCGVSVI